MSDLHKPIGELPEDWTCKECGQPAWQYACCEPRSKMNCDDAASAEEYGTGTDQFADAEEIELCGYCGGSRWQKPGCATVR